MIAGCLRSVRKIGAKNGGDVENSAPGQPRSSNVAARAAQLADAERALSARLDAATSIGVSDDDGGDDDAPFTASTLLEALEVLAARKSVLVSRARGERRPPSRVERAWLETLRAEVALLE